MNSNTSKYKLYPSLEILGSRVLLLETFLKIINDHDCVVHLFQISTKIMIAVSFWTSQVYMTILT